MGANDKRHEAILNEAGEHIDGKFEINGKDYPARQIVEWLCDGGPAFEAGGDHSPGRKPNPDNKAILKRHPEFGDIDTVAEAKRVIFAY